MPFINETISRLLWNYDQQDQLLRDLVDICMLAEERRDPDITSIKSIASMLGKHEHSLGRQLDALQRLNLISLSHDDEPRVSFTRTGLEVMARKLEIH